ncbi:MAG: hypothetical protein AAGE52_35340 [Myxococcota bacterium]
MRTFGLLSFALACSTTPPPAPRAPSPQTAASAQPQTTCTVHSPDGTQIYSFDRYGRLAERATIGDAAGTQYEERWTRDDDGRVLRLEEGLVEGVGDHEPRTSTFTYESAGSIVVARTGSRSVRWAYDDRGRPVRRTEEREGAPTAETTCAYDDQGRVIARGETRFVYEGESLIPSAMVDPDFGTSRPVTQVFDALVRPGFDARPYSPGGDVSRFVGDCVAVLVEPCGLAFAPPRSDGRRTPIRHSSYASLERALAAGLCRDSPDCVHRVLFALRGEGPLRSVVVVRLSRGDQEVESTHLVVEREDGWWPGLPLADGPFLGNQVVGTLAFELKSASLAHVLEGGDLEFLAEYETTEVLADDSGEREVRETGTILCVDLRANTQRCARIVTSLVDASEEGSVEASATIAFPGDGTVQVRDREGSHARVLRESGPVDWLFAY